MYGPVAQIPVPKGDEWVANYMKKIIYEKLKFYKSEDLVLELGLSKFTR